MPNGKDMDMKYLTFALLLLITGCFGGPIKVNVYGSSGKAYTAPDLCSALIACKNSTEAACYYDNTIIVDATGKATETSICKEIKK